MFPNFAACLELNHSCNEEREERSGELSAQSQERTKNLNATGNNFSAQPTLGLQEVTTVQITWEAADSLCCALTCNAVYSLEMLLMA